MLSLGVKASDSGPLRSRRVGNKGRRYKSLVTSQIEKTKPCIILYCPMTYNITTREKYKKQEPDASVFYISQVSSNVRRILWQYNKYFLLFYTL